MPKQIEAKLRRTARKKGLTGAAKNRYVYGGLTNIKKRQVRAGRAAPRKRRRH